MRFFFLSGPLPSPGGRWPAPAALLRHLRALRIGPGQDFLLLPEEGGPGLLSRWAGGEELELLGIAERPTLALRELCLATAWPKGPRADELVTRATEAGVARIQPVIFERSIAGREPFRAQRLERWQRLARESGQQCRNPSPPALASTPLPLEEALAALAGDPLVVLSPGAPPLGALLAELPAGPLALLVGPEGGFSPAELALLESRGLPRAGLLPTVLRIEAAGPLAAALCQLSPVG